jgi:hypothetical protein
VQDKGSLNFRISSRSTTGQVSLQVWNRQGRTG